MGQIVSDVTDIIDYNKAKKSEKTQRKEILEQMAQDDAEKTNLIKKVLSAQRAKYGASGMSSSGVTEGAVLKRLRSETAQPYAEKRKNNLAKLKSIKTSKPNLLTKWLSKFDDIVG
ncbi:MAG: hypothetical protein UIH99_00480 [Alphaproteobacteria bacterium]|jgi:hypothetical protein|nr:hypothetical protein [Alphaproteobacteria bacterium]